MLDGALIRAPAALLRSIRVLGSVLPKFLQDTHNGVSPRFDGGAAVLGTRPRGSRTHLTHAGYTRHTKATNGGNNERIKETARKG